MLIVGERINSSNKRIALAIEKRDAGFIQREARSQVDAGAHLVDVNAGTFLEQEPECLRWLVQAVQQVVEVPLCLDSSSPRAIAAGLGVHQGKALVNSVTAQTGHCEEIIPLVKQYGCGVVALCLSDEGVPRTPKERLMIASPLFRRLTDAGIPPDDIYMDPAVIPFSTDAHAARDILESISQMVRTFQGVHTICGISNISFGLPLRRQLNQAFLVMAVAAGLDTVILDPCDTRAMVGLFTARALLGHRDYRLEYIKTYREARLGLP